MRGETKLPGLLAARWAWPGAKEVACLICEITGTHLAGQLASGRQDESCLPEGRSPGCTIVRWRDQIVAWHQPS
jgi:hypothetical protein